MPPSGSSEEHIRGLAHDILSEPEFVRFRHDPSSFSWEWLKDWLRWFLSFLNGTADVSLAAYLLFWGTLVAIALLIVVQAVWALRAVRHARTPDASTQRTAGAADLAAQADAFARDGRFLEAAHCLHLACIESLLRSDVLQLSRSDPNRTLRRRLASSRLAPEKVAEMCALLDRMETSWFRTRHEDPSLYEAWHGLHERLREEVPA